MCVLKENISFLQAKAKASTVVCVSVYVLIRNCYQCVKRFKIFIDIQLASIPHLK